MAWIYIIPIFFLTDILLYIKYWQAYARRYYFIDYHPTVGWAMVYKLRKMK